MPNLSSLTQYFKDSKTELKKVTWPTRKDTINHTLIVIGFSLAVSFFLGLIDFILSTVFEKIILK